MFETLGQFFEPIMSQIDRLMGNPTAEGINAIRRQLKTTVLFDVAKLRRHYGKLLKAYYAKNKPFNHRESSKSLEERFSKDMEDFIELVSYAAEAGDTSILDDWAINYPCRNNQILAKDLSAYLDAFQGIVRDWEYFMEQLQSQGGMRWPDEAKPYWAYLANKISSKV